MTVTAPESAVRMELMSILEAEFGEEADVRDDALHESLGHEIADDRMLIGIYPASAQERPQAGVVQETTIYVQVFGGYDLKIDPEQARTPIFAEERAERVRRAVQGAAPTTGQQLWYFRVTRTEYPKDPTGNITRSLSTILAYSDNASLVETEG